MKRTFTIGRDPSCCDIVIYDVTDVVSRSHATLRVDGRRLYLTDHSTNGTYRNGIRLTPYVEYKVTRDDDISFGNVAHMDWNAVPIKKLPANTPFYVAILALLVIIAAGAAFYISKTKGIVPVNEQEIELPTIQKDTAEVVTPANDGIADPSAPAKEKPAKVICPIKPEKNKLKKKADKPSRPAEDDSRESEKSIDNDSF